MTTCPRCPPGHPCDEACLRKTVIELRATVKRLNRRCQAAEAAALDTVERCQRAGMPFGRVAANWAAEHQARLYADLIDKLFVNELSARGVDYGRCRVCGATTEYGKTRNDIEHEPDCPVGDAKHTTTGRRPGE